MHDRRATRSTAALRSQLATYYPDHLQWAGREEDQTSSGAPRLESCGTAERAKPAKNRKAALPSEVYPSKSRPYVPGRLL